MNCKGRTDRVNQACQSGSATSEELAGAGALSWYASEGKRVSRSPYVIQGVSATVRGQTKLISEGEPQGDNRQAPEPPDTPS
jgi:hypothetical protein